MRAARGSPPVSAGGMLTALARKIARLNLLVLGQAGAVLAQPAAQFVA